jgi:hypothetical protein
LKAYLARPMFFWHTSRRTPAQPQGRCRRSGSLSTRRTTRTDGDRRKRVCHAAGRTVLTKHGRSGEGAVRGQSVSLLHDASLLERYRHAGAILSRLVTRTRRPSQR